MNTWDRIVWYAVEFLAIAALLLLPVGCDRELLNSLGSNVIVDQNDEEEDSDPDSMPNADIVDDDPSPLDDESEPSDNSPIDDSADDLVDDLPSNDSSDDDSPSDAPDDDQNDEPEVPPNPSDDPEPEPEPDEPAEPADPDDDPAALDDIPENDYCDTVADWSDTWRAYEVEVLTLVNQHRAAGADCGSQGTFASTHALTMNGTLRCAARAHSMDMSVRSFFSHTNPDGDGPGARLGYAGWAGFTWGENIAWGYSSPTAVVNGWMNSDGHCANIMRSNYTQIGVGYYQGNYWTQAFGAQ